MSDDIEQFLRQAARKRAGRGQQPPPVEIVEAQPVAPPPALEPLVEAQLAETPPRTKIGSHVEQYLDNRRFAERASHLGEDVSQADEDLDARVHAAFDHEVGRMDDSSGFVGATPAQTPTTNLAQQLIEMVKNPSSVRQAVILSEILKRPEM